MSDRELIVSIVVSAIAVFRLVDKLDLWINSNRDTETKAAYRERVG